MALELTCAGQSLSVSILLWSGVGLSRPNRVSLRGLVMSVHEIQAIQLSKSVEFASDAEDVILTCSCRPRLELEN